MDERFRGTLATGRRVYIGSLTPMPTIVGGLRNYERQPINPNDPLGPKETYSGFSLSHKHYDRNGNSTTVFADDVEIRNFWIEDFQTGVEVVFKDGSQLTNIVCRNNGRTDLQHSGNGIILSGSTKMTTVSNCIVLNHTNAAFSLGTGCDDNTFNDCKAYADDNSVPGVTPMDYYFQVTAGSDNTFNDCVAERHLGANGYPKHSGHGFVIAAENPASANYNRFNDCSAKNIGETFVMRGAGTALNFYTACKSTWDTNESVQAVRDQGNIELQGGAHHNILSRMSLINSRYAVRFAANGNHGAGSLTAGEGNVFANCIFECRDSAIWMCTTSGSQTTKHVKDNTFLNCTFVGAATNLPEFFWNERVSSGNKLINCIIAGFYDYSDLESPGSNAYPISFSFETCCFFNPWAVTEFDGAKASGPDNFEADPEFSSTTTWDLMSTSPCKNEGVDTTSTGTLFPGFEFDLDVDGDPRKWFGYVDIGAQEYDGN